MSTVEIRSSSGGYIFTRTHTFKPRDTLVINLEHLQLDDLKKLQYFFSINLLTGDVGVYSTILRLIKEFSISFGEETIEDVSDLFLKEDKNNKVNDIGEGSLIQYPNTLAVKSFVKDQLDLTLTPKIFNSMVKSEGIPLYTLGKDGSYILCEPDSWIEISDNLIIPCYMKNKIVK